MVLFHLSPIRWQEWHKYTIMTKQLKIKEWHSNTLTKMTHDNDNEVNYTLMTKWHINETYIYYHDKNDTVIEKKLKS